MESAGILYKILDLLMFFAKGNKDFFKILNEFQDKLPPVQKRAKQHYDENLGFVIVNTSKMQMSNLTTKDIDLFQKKLENFNYKRILFKQKEIVSYSNNIQRLIKTSKWEEFGIAMVQSILEDESNQDSKPYIFGRYIGERIGY